LRQTIDGAAFRKMMISAAASVENHKQAINELNVFPVPDGDTGTNMAMTIGAAVQDLRGLDSPSLTRAADAAASAMLRGARGNSGVILSLLFRGFSKALKGLDDAGGAEFAAALQSGVDAAYKAVMKPAEGTILTVSRVCAHEAAEEALQQDAIEHVIEFAIKSAKSALDATVHQNPILEKAGVVDAGGMGFLLILEGMLASLRGEDVIAAEPTGAVKEQANFSDFATEDIKFAYCTEFIVSRENGKDPELLRDFLNQLGDSLVLVDDEEIIKVHVHTNNPGTVLQEALSYGGLVTVKVENMRLQHTEKVMNEKDLASKVAPPEKRFGSVAVCVGDGLAATFRDLGVDQIVQGGQTMNPSTEDILEAVNRTPAEIIFVLPNNKNIIMAAQQVIPLTGKQVVVLPSKTVPQGITAMLAFDPDGELEVNTKAMTDAMAGVETMQITYAARDSEFDGHHIQSGDYLALLGSSLFGTGKDLNTLLMSLADHVREESKEFVTIFYGRDILEEDAQKAAAVFSSRCPQAEVNLLSGGQPVYYYLISAE